MNVLPEIDAVLGGNLKSLLDVTHTFGSSGVAGQELTVAQMAESADRLRTAAQEAASLLLLLGMTTAEADTARSIGDPSTERAPALMSPQASVVPQMQSRSGQPLKQAQMPSSQPTRSKSSNGSVSKPAIPKRRSPMRASRPADHASKGHNDTSWSSLERGGYYQAERLYGQRLALNGAVYPVYAEELLLHRLLPKNTWSGIVTAAELLFDVRSANNLEMQVTRNHVYHMALQGLLLVSSTRGYRPNLTPSAPHSLVDIEILGQPQRLNTTALHMLHALYEIESKDYSHAYSKATARLLRVGAQQELSPLLFIMTQVGILNDHKGIELSPHGRREARRIFDARPITAITGQ